VFRLCEPGLRSQRNHLRDRIIRAASAFHDDPRAFPVQPIIGWGEPYAELPDAFLWESVGVTVDSDTQDLVREAEGDPDHGDKLGGWPGQSSALPECPSCARPSSLLFQVASFDSVPKSFGLEGVLNIFSCDACPQFTTLRIESG
jgi:hypothetical protein